MHPWLDRSGRLAPLKAVTFCALFLPALALAGEAALDQLGPRPWTAAIHEAGLWTIRLLYLSLAVTPLRQIAHWPRLLLVRRMIGVAAFAYALLHLGLYAGDQGFRLLHVAAEIVRRFYLTIGFAALVGLSALAATSTDGMVRRLGGRRWQALHRLVYGIGILASVHFFLQSKLDVGEPLVMAGLYAWLMLYRAVRPSRGALRWWALAGLSLAAGALTLGGEALYYWLRNGVDPMRVLAAALSLQAGIRPGWVVTAITLPLALVGWWRSAATAGPQPGTRTPAAPWRRQPLA